MAAKKTSQKNSARRGRQKGFELDKTQLPGSPSKQRLEAAVAALGWDQGELVKAYWAQGNTRTRDYTADQKKAARDFMAGSISMEDLRTKARLKTDGALMNLLEEARS